MHEELSKGCEQHVAGSIPVGRHGAFDSPVVSDPEKPAPDLIRRVKRFPACAKPLRDRVDRRADRRRQARPSANKALERSDNSKKSHPAAADGLINRERTRYAQ